MLNHRYRATLSGPSSSAVVVLVLACGVLPVGCKPRKGGVAAADDAGYVVVRQPDGRETQVRLGPGEIPPEFPPRVPLYPGARFTSTGRTSKSVVISLETRDPPDMVRAFYRKQGDYRELSDLEIEGTKVLSLRHVASSREVQVTTKVTAGVTRVGLVAPQ